MLTNIHFSIKSMVSGSSMAAWCRSSGSVDNIFGIGDCTNVPTSRTAAACAAESAVLMKNLLSVVRGETLSSKVIALPLVCVFVLLYSDLVHACMCM